MAAAATRTDAEHEPAHRTKSKAPVETPSFASPDHRADVAEACPARERGQRHSFIQSEDGTVCAFCREPAPTL